MDSNGNLKIEPHLVPIFFNQYLLFRSTNNQAQNYIQLINLLIQYNYSRSFILEAQNLSPHKHDQPASLPASVAENIPSDCHKANSGLRFAPKIGYESAKTPPL